MDTIGHRGSVPNGGISVPDTATDSDTVEGESGSTEDFVDKQDESKQLYGATIFPDRDPSTEKLGNDDGENDDVFSPSPCWRIDKKMVFYKMFYLAFAGGLGAVLPYVSVFLKQRGMSPMEIGIISGMRPVIGFICAPLITSCGDHYGIRRWLFLVSIVAWFACYIALFFIPTPDVIHRCPREFKYHREDADDSPRSRREVPSIPHEMLSGYSEPDDVEILKESTGWLYQSASLQWVFFVALAVILGGEIVQAPTTAFADAGTLQTLGKDALESYGPQRAWGSVGFGLASLLAGGIVSSSREARTICGVELYFSDYRMLTYVFIAFLVVAFAAATQIKFKEGSDEETIELTSPSASPQVDAPPKPKETHSTLAVIRIFFNVHYGSWLTASFFVGVCNGLIWGFLFWHLENLGADQLLMGIASTVTCLSEFVMFFCVGRVIKAFGHMGIMYVGLIGYAIRFCVYALIKNPWWVLPAEVLQGITFSSVWVSMTAYTTLAVPSISLATIQGILHGVYFGLGNGSGHLIGGLMIGYFGAVITFFVFSGACVVAFILFIIAQKCSTKPSLQQYGYKDLDAEVTADK